MYITCNELHVYTTLYTVSNECSAAKCLVHVFPTLVFQRKSERGAKCLTPGLCWACDRARIRLLIHAGVHSATAVSAWHLNGTVMVRKQVSLGRSDQVPHPLRCMRLSATGGWSCSQPPGVRCLFSHHSSAVRHFHN